MTVSDLLSRRGFLLAGLASGTLVAGTGAFAYLRHRRTAWKTVSTDPHVFLHIDPDDTVTVLIKHLEMGQGIMTGLTTLVAEELDADWAQMRARLAPGDQELFKNALYGRQATAASTSIHNSWTQMRQVGAAARQMLITAAARDWGVADNEIGIKNGRVRHEATGRESGFGALADAAMSLEAPKAEALKLKRPEEWSLIGQSLPRVDAPEKLDGSAVFSLDIRRPNMLRAVVARSPRFGGRIARFDASAALALDDVVEVFEVPSGVAVLAENSWAAIRGRALLDLTWDDGTAETRSSEEMLDEYREVAEGQGLEAQSIGNTAKALEAATELRRYEYTFPFLAHAPLEPLNATIDFDGETARVWAGCQLHTLDQWAVADVLGLDRDAVRIETPFTGSSFGRRAYSVSDWMVELGQIAKASTLGRPIQVIWTREDDLSGGVYRPLALHKAVVGRDALGRISGWEHHVVCKSLMKGTPWEVYLLKNGADRSSIGGITEHAYDIPDMRVVSYNVETPITVGFWRSISDSHNLFATETIMDDLAAAAGVDPVAFRLDYLKPDAVRERAVLKRVADMADSAGTLPAGSERGVALTRDHIIGKTTHVAMISEVTLEDGNIKVERISVAVDCGIPINPNIIRTQVESSISFALSTVLRNAITLEGGIVQQQNFDGYDPTRMEDMPEVHVAIMASEADPSGIGEAAVAPVGPSIANALFRLTGQLQTSLPLGPVG